MTLAVQISHKTPAGKIFVIGGNNIDELRVNLLALYSTPDEDPAAAEEAAEELLSEMAQVLSPLGAGTAAVMAAMPGTQVMAPQGPYGPQGPPQPQYAGNVGAMGQSPRYAAQDTYFHSSFADKDAVKAAGGRWGKERKSWYAPAGSDLNAFARWGV